jgi:hypothetical protein
MDSHGYFAIGQRRPNECTVIATVPESKIKLARSRDVHALTEHTREL